MLMKVLSLRGRDDDALIIERAKATGNVLLAVLAGHHPFWELVQGGSARRAFRKGCAKGGTVLSSQQGRDPSIVRHFGYSRLKLAGLQSVPAR